MRRKGREGMEKDFLKKASTKELADELSRREGVETKQAEPYQDLVFAINGPAIVMIVTD